MNDDEFKIQIADDHKDTDKTDDRLKTYQKKKANR